MLGVCSLRPTDNIELSVVLPCLNEEQTVGACVDAAHLVLSRTAVSGEVIVADNASTDGSREVASARGARVVTVRTRGYGAAVMGGINAARGRYVLIADADASYDLLELPKFLAALRSGVQLVQGCRLPGGGGDVIPGAMPFLHRRIGNPMFSWLARTWFHAPIHDVQCGMRAVAVDAYRHLGLQCTGMEFASEMVIKASMSGCSMAEIPITLHRDGRTAHDSHLRTFRDGWRNLRFYLIYSPTWLFVVPGVSLMVLGIIGYCIAMPSVTIARVRFDVHTLLFSSLAIIAGYQSVLFAMLAKTFAVTQGLLRPDRVMTTLARTATLERGLAASLTVMCGGATLLGLAMYQWWMQEFGNLNVGHTMRVVIPGVTLAMMGFQSTLSCFLWSILSLKRQ